VLAPQTIALFFTVALLAVTAYFLLGSIPLLTLQHDNPVDSRFIRSFYITYFRIAFMVAIATATSYFLAARVGFALGAAVIAVLTWVLRRHFITQMDHIADQIQADKTEAIPAFQKLHKSAIAINTTQLMTILCSLGFF
jgi:hypothetical protein